MKNIAIRFVFLALCLLLGHSFVSHHHHSEHQASFHLSQTKQNFSVLLSELYSLDLGKSHLEHYQVPSFDIFLNSIQVFDFQFFMKQSFRIYLCSYFDVFIKSFILENKSLRSPPFFA